MFSAQPGQAVVELMVVLSVVMLLLVGLMDFAPALVNAGQLSQAVREGVDYGHMNPSDTAGINARVRNAAPTLALPDASIVVTCNKKTSNALQACASSKVGDTVTVQATFAYTPKFGIFIALVGQSITLTRSATSLIY
jgi:Flp pilus assembly protein TadG